MLKTRTQKSQTSDVYAIEMTAIRGIDTVVGNPVATKLYF